MSGALSLLSSCAPHYLDGALSPDCRGGKCGPGGAVPPGCRQHNAVYTILHYLTDIDFPSTKVTSSLDTLPQQLPCTPHLYLKVLKRVS